MKISLNWLKNYVETTEDISSIGDILTNIGLEVEGTEFYETVKGSLEGLVVGEVMTCQKHPNADKLSVTTVDVGSDELLQIVCGAPNVAKGQKVVIATVGTELYPKDGEAFKIKKGKIRGEVSMGMICAEDEIGLGSSHEGILVLDPSASVGTPVFDLFKGEVSKDCVYEIGLTPNRSDATSHMGVAFDLSAALKTNFSGQGNFSKPDISSTNLKGAGLEIEVEVEDNARCKRYTGISIKGVKIAASPKWMQHYLMAIGIEPKNNIVDITNFVLHETGQPLHAFDYDKIIGKKILVKCLREGTSFKGLDEETRQLHAEDLMICDGMSTPMCIAGVFGGADSGVHENTTNIFLESAFFDAISVRKSSMRHQLRTDAATRFEKGSDPENTLFALKRALYLIEEYAGGSVASDLIDIYPAPVPKQEISLSFKQVNELTGIDFESKDIKNILNYLEFEILSKNQHDLKLAIPTNKVDVQRPADVIEEILRIYGYNNVPEKNIIQSVLAFSQKPEKHKVTNIISDQLTSLGFCETMATSMTKSEYFRSVLKMDENELVFVNNTSNQHLDVMRPSMLFSGLETLIHNQNRQQHDVKIYEFGKTYHSIKTQEGLSYKEDQHLSLFVTGNLFSQNWLHTQTQKVNFFTLKSYVDNILSRFGIAVQKLQKQQFSDEIFTYGMKYHRGEQTIVNFGRVNGNINLKMDLKQEVFYADFNFDNFMKMLKKHSLTYQALSKFPAVRRDLALIIDRNISYEEIYKIAQKCGGKHLIDTNLFDVYENEQHIGHNKKSCSISFIFQDDEKTMKEKDIEKLMSKLISSYEQQLGAFIRK